MKIGYCPLRAAVIYRRREVRNMEILKTILTILEVIASIVMIAVVVLQSGKQAGLSGAIAGNNYSYLSKTKGGNLDSMLASATKWIALVWVLLTLSLSLF